MMFAVSGHPVFPADLGTKPDGTHPPGHPALAHPAASILKLSDLGTSVAPLAAVIDLPDLRIQPLIIHIAPARLALQPPIISAARHLKNSAHLQHTENRAVLAYERIPMRVRREDGHCFF